MQKMNEELEYFLFLMEGIFSLVINSDKNSNSFISSLSLSKRRWIELAGLKNCSNIGYWRKTNTQTAVMNFVSY